MTGTSELASTVGNGNETVDAQTILRVQDAGKRYRRGWALRSFSLSVPRGSITALIGPNGAGKTTLMRAVVGLTGLTEGRITVNDRPVNATTALPEVGYLSQDKPLYRQYTVATTLQLGRHLNNRWDAALALRLCEDAGLDQRARVRTLSGGQRTRLALSLALARRPELLLLDEPLSDLDPLARVEVQQTLLAEATETGMTVVMSSHILGEIQDVCSDLALITDGRPSLQGTVEQLMSRHLLLVGPAESEAAPAWLPVEGIIEQRRSARQQTLLVDGPLVDLPGRALPDGWTAHEPTLDEIVIARFRNARSTGAAACPRSKTKAQT